MWTITCSSFQASRLSPNERSKAIGSSMRHELGTHITDSMKPIRHPANTHHPANFLVQTTDNKRRKRYPSSLHIAANAQRRSGIVAQREVEKKQASAQVATSRVQTQRCTAKSVHCRQRFNFGGSL